MRTAGAARAGNRTPLVSLLPAAGGLVISLAVGTQLAGPLASLVVVGLVAVAFLVLAILRFRWAAAVLLAVSPFYFVIKGVVPAPFTSIWRDLLIVLLLSGWAALTLGGRPGYRSGRVAFLGLALLAWGLIELLRAPELKFGLYGFRSLLLPLVLLIPFAHSLEDRKAGQLYIRTLAAVGTLVAVQCIAQFVLVNGHVIQPGTSIDTGRALDIATRGSSISARFGFERSYGPWPETGQVGIFLAGIAGLLAPMALRPGLHRRRALLALLVVLLGLVTTLSTWPIVATLAVLLLLGVGAWSQRSNLRWIVAAAVVGGLVGALLFVPTGSLSERGVEPFVQESYSLGSTAANLQNLRQALLGVDLLGAGLYAPGPGARTAGEASFATGTLGEARFLIDGLVVQVGLVGVALLYGLWLIALLAARKAHRLAQASRNDRPDVLDRVTWSGLLVLFLGSIHYGAPIIYGPDLMLVLLWAAADRWSRRTATAGHVGTKAAWRP